MEAELLRFIESLWKRGLLTENPESFDYEWVIWGYLKRKEHNGKSSS
jgi:hypothetical protein